MAVASAVLAAFASAVPARAQEVEPRKRSASAPAANLAETAPDSTMMLRNGAGQEIKAKLLSAHGDQVRIERVDDGRVFMVHIDAFDEYSGERIRSWIDRDPEAVEFSLAFTATKNLVNSSTFMSAGRDFKFAEWSYRVTVRNLTRNMLSGAQLEYRLVFDDNVEIVRTVVGPGKGANQQEGQLVDLPEMVFNDEIEFDTPPIALHAYEYAPQRGEREYSRDTLKGIWIRVLRNGRIIGEYQSSPSMGSLSWDNEDKIDIRVTNRFRDQLGTAPKK